jgi:hypothetical protein
LILSIHNDISVFQLQKSVGKPTDDLGGVSIESD